MGKATLQNPDWHQGILQEPCVHAHVCVCVCMCRCCAALHAILVHLAIGTLAGAVVDAVCLGLVLGSVGAKSFSLETCNCHMGRGVAVWGGCGAPPLTCRDALVQWAQGWAITSSQSRTWLATLRLGHPAERSTDCGWRRWYLCIWRPSECCCGCGGARLWTFDRRILRQNCGADEGQISQLGLRSRSTLSIWSPKISALAAESPTNPALK